MGCLYCQHPYILDESYDDDDDDPVQYVYRWITYRVNTPSPSAWLESPDYIEPRTRHINSGQLPFESRHSTTRIALVLYLLYVSRLSVCLCLYSIKPKSQLYVMVMIKFGLKIDASTRYRQHQAKLLIEPLQVFWSVWNYAAAIYTRHGVLLLLSLSLIPTH